MYIKSLTIQNFRAFQKKIHLKFGRYLTAIAGMNGIGKSTILAILSNSCELNKKYGVSLDHSLFRGDFSDIIYYDSSHDKSFSKAAIITFSRNVAKGTPTVRYRSTIQQHKRYRLIPSYIKDDGKRSSAKIQWPVAYLGLSRIYPIGESKNVTIKTIDKPISKKIVQIHAEIMGEKFDNNSYFESVNKDKLRRRKSGTGINTKEYSATSNSSGQDDLGKIILTIMSFHHLKDHPKNGYHYEGGLVVIDELDATLHPAAQYNLLCWLYKEAQELDLQIVFTTHSLSLLHDVRNLRKNVTNKHYVKIMYLRKLATGNIEEESNPSPRMIYYDLNDTCRQYLPGNIHHMHKIKVFTEDKVAIYFLRRMLNYVNNKEPSDKRNNILYEIDPIKFHFNWKQLLVLSKVNTNSIDDNVYIVDPDVNNSLRKLFISSVSKYKIPSKDVNTSHYNLFIFPGKYAIEKLVWKFAASLTLKNDWNFFQIRAIHEYNLLPKYIHRYGPASSRYKKYGNSKKADEDGITMRQYKEWFKNNMEYVPYYMDYWMKKNFNDIKAFVGILSSHINKEYNEMNRL